MLQDHAIWICQVRRALHWRWITVIIAKVGQLSTVDDTYKFSIWDFLLIMLSPSCDLSPWGTLCFILLLSKVLSTFLYLDTELFRTVRNTFYQKTICGDLLYYQKLYYNIITPQCRQTIASEPLSLFLTLQSQLVFWQHFIYKY